MSETVAKDNWEGIVILQTAENSSESKCTASTQDRANNYAEHMSIVLHGKQPGTERGERPLLSGFWIRHTAFMEAER
jgi:hypothetical protein